LTERAWELVKLVLVRWAESFAVEALVGAAPASPLLPMSASASRTEPVRSLAALRRLEGTIRVSECKQATFLTSTKTSLQSKTALTGGYVPDPLRFW
jgi:hypothetical protein